MSQFFNNIFLKYQCGFRKSFSTQQCLLTMKRGKKSFDNGKAFGALLTDLSKTFNCLDHELLIAKLNAYGFSLTALKLIHDYLSNRKERTKINSPYNDWHDIILGVSQGSILGPLLFNIFLIDLFFIVEDFDIASYANGNTPYVNANNMDRVVKSLEEASNQLFKWFSDNIMKSNADKCHLLVSTNNTVNIRVENFDIENSDCEKLSVVKFDYELTFNSHISDLCKKASKKVHALSKSNTIYEYLEKTCYYERFF